MEDVNTELCTSCGQAAPTGVRARAYLTIEETAKILCVSTMTIRRRIRSGELPAKCLVGGQTVLIDERHVLRLLEDVKPGECARGAA